MPTKEEIRDKIKNFSHKNYNASTKSSTTDSTEKRAPKDKMTKAIDAESQKQGAKARGSYNESAGGGTPGTGGRGGMHSDGDSKNAGSRDFVLADNKDDPVAQKAKDAGIPVRYAQPRDDNGQFTYNSANNRGLSTKYSRGHTLPPFLQGVNLTFIKKGSEFQYTDADGKIKRVIASIDMTPEELISACKKYLETEGGFAAIVGTAITKKGAPSKAAKETPKGKVGDLDVSTLRQSTQDNLSKVSQNKDGQWIADQTLVSDIIAPKGGGVSLTNKKGNPAYAYKLAQEGPNAQPPVKKTTTPKNNINNAPTTPTTPAMPKQNVGAGTGTSPQPQPTNTNTQKDPSKKIFTETSKKFDDSYKSELKNDPKKWISENKDKIKKAIEKNPNLTPGSIANAIYSGKVSKWDDLL